MLVLEFQRGLGADLSDPGVIERTELMGVLDRARDGVDRVSSRDAVRALRGPLLAPAEVGRPEYLRLGGREDRELEALGWRGFLLAGVITE